MLFHSLRGIKHLFGFSFLSVISYFQFGPDKDVFGPRFSKNISTTFQQLFKCPPEEQVKVFCTLVCFSLFIQPESLRHPIEHGRHVEDRNALAYHRNILN